MWNRRLPFRRALLLPLLLISPFSSPGGASAQAGASLKESAILQINTLNRIKSEKTLSQAKIDSRLFLGILKQRNDPRLVAPKSSKFAPLTDFRFVKPDADGRIAVRGPMLARGLRHPHASGLTALVDDDGWFHTGDLATRDEDGYLWFAGRADSPWYPTLRLFRQPRLGDWPTLFHEMADQLADLVAAARDTTTP